MDSTCCLLDVLSKGGVAYRRPVLFFCTNIFLYPVKCVSKCVLRYDYCTICTISLGYVIY
jgi:hypothetical protein